MRNTEKEVRTSIPHKTRSHEMFKMLAKFVLLTKTTDVTCKEAMTLVAWKQENVKQNTGVNLR